jgi:hypothetical protein
MTLADRLLYRAQAQAMFLEQEKKLPNKSRRATAEPLRKTAPELNK